MTYSPDCSEVFDASKHSYNQDKLLDFWGMRFSEGKQTMMSHELDTPHWPIELLGMAPYPMTSMVNTRSGGLIWFVSYNGRVEMIDNDSGFKPYYRKETFE